MKERITLLTAIAAIVLVAFARCEPPRGLPRQVEESEEEERDLPAGDPDQFTVGPIFPKSPAAVPKPKPPEPVVTAPNERMLIPLRPDRETVHHHIIYGDIDNPHADEDIVIKPPGSRTWPMPVLPYVK
ncbi:MAG: hypothetical protein ACI89X_003941 [Planctomycetota bacterium]|jgi:hypothetical protein